MGRCSAIIIVLIVSMGVVMVLLWIGAAKDPGFKGRGLYIPALDRSTSDSSPSSGRHNNTIVLDIEVHNHNMLTGIYYEQGVNLSMFFGPGLVGEATIPAFYQGSLKRLHKQAVLDGNGSAWEAVLQQNVNGTVAFAVVLRTVIRFKGAVWNKRKHCAQYFGDVFVGDDGKGRW